LEIIMIRNALKFYVIKLNDEYLDHNYKFGSFSNARLYKKINYAKSSVTQAVYFHID
jgi:hypothetical protein